MSLPTITCAVVHDVGSVRETQEDSYLAWTAPGGSSASGLQAVFAVADGMGGHSSGEVASQIVIRHLQRFLCDLAEQLSFATSDEVSAYLAELLSSANQEVHNLPTERGAEARPPGTTLTVAVVWGDQLLLRHVGDTRCYLLRGSEADLLTADHTFAFEQVARGSMTKEQAALSPLRNRLTRCMGTEEQAILDSSLHDLAEGDLLVLCSDGLYGAVPAEVALRTVATEPPRAAADALRGAALNAGARDNVTLVLAQIGQRELLASDAELTFGGVAGPDREVESAPVMPGLNRPLSLLVLLSAVLVLTVIVPRLMRSDIYSQQPVIVPPAGYVNSGQPPASPSTAAPTATTPPIPQPASQGTRLAISGAGKDLVLQCSASTVAVHGSANYSAQTSDAKRYSIALRSAAAGQKYVLKPAGGGQVAANGTVGTDPSLATLDLLPGDYELYLADGAILVATLRVQ